MWSGFISIISSIILLNIFISSKMANYSLFWAVMNFHEPIDQSCIAIIRKSSNEFDQNRVENIKKGWSTSFLALWQWCWVVWLHAFHLFARNRGQIFGPDPEERGWRVASFLHLLYLLAKCHQKFEFSELKFSSEWVFCVVIISKQAGLVLVTR